MEWYDILLKVLGAVGAFMAGGWLLNLYMAKPKKNSIEIENMKSAMSKLQEIINQLMETNETRMKDSEAYRRETSKTIKELKDDVADLSLRLDIKHEAIYASSRCRFIEKEDDCIVMKTFKEKCEECLNKKI